MAGNPRLMFSTLGCPSWTLEQAADAAVAHGYGGLEIRLLDEEIIPADLTEGQRQRIRDVMTSRGLQVIGLGASTRFTASDADERSEFEKELEAYIGLAAALEVPYVRTFGGNTAECCTMEQSVSWVAQSLNNLAPIAEAADITILLETHDAFCKGKDVAAVLDKVPSSHVQAVWDVHHPWRMGESVTETWNYIGNRVAHVHLKDARHRTDGSFVLSLMGKGDVPNQEIVELLEAKGYTGCYSAEWEKKWHPDIEEPEIALPQHAEVILSWLQ